MFQIISIRDIINIIFGNSINSKNASKSQNGYKKTYRGQGR